MLVRWCCGSEGGEGDGYCSAGVKGPMWIGEGDDARQGRWRRGGLMRGMMLGRGDGDGVG